MAVWNSTGFHPSVDLKVRPIDPQLNTIVELMTKQLTKILRQQRLSTTTTGNNDNFNFDFNFNFNSVEIKLYHGEDIYRDPSTGNTLVDQQGNPLRKDCNKTIMPHCDRLYNDQGIQDPNDTVVGDHPIVTLSIGSPRKLTFYHQWKPMASSSSGKGAAAGRRKWSEPNGSRKDAFWLEQGSLFCLLPEDEIPQPIGTRLHKTKHGAKFDGTGISVALVFRSVKTTSKFQTKTHRWLWQKDETYKHRVKKRLKNRDRYHKLKSEKESCIGSEIHEMQKNVVSFLDQKRRERFGVDADVGADGGAGADDNEMQRKEQQL